MLCLLHVFQQDTWLYVHLTHIATSMGVVNLSAVQSVTIHGIWNPRPVLMWADVQHNPFFTWRYLLSIGISKTSLMKLQPVGSEWLLLKDRVHLADIPEMSAWCLHPIRDMGCTLADILQLEWTADMMTRMCVTYDQLVSIGMNSQTMSLFGFTLLQWVHMGFNRQHVLGMSEQDAISALNMTHRQLLQSLGD
jgi:hypothetical protein